VIRTAESPAGQIAATVLAWLLIVLALAPGVMTGMVPGNRASDFGIPICIDIFLASLALLLHWIGTAADRSEEYRGGRLMAFRIVAGFVVLYPLLCMALDYFKGK